MDREANYVAVGAFVLLVLFLGAGFVFWYSDTADSRNVTRYEIYFDGSRASPSTRATPGACASSPTSASTRR
jgi:hypothetical protein